MLFVLNRSARNLRQEVLQGMLALSGNTTTSINQSLTGINETLRQLHTSIGEVQAERVEFAVKMPGAGKNAEPFWLPIDSKFPTEDYIRLVEYSAAGNLVGVEAASKAIEVCVRECARTIHDKYVNPPRTTDLAILFLPSEGLYGEVLRRPGLAEELQRDYRVMLAGPTNLFAILSSLSVGFRTMAVEQHATEIHELLGAVRREFQSFALSIERSKRQAQTVLTGISDVETRFRMMDRTLKSVDTGSPEETAELSSQS